MGLVSAFDGIGGAFVAWQLLGLALALRISFKIDHVACKVARDNFPDIVHLGDIVAVTDEQLRDAYIKALRLQHVLVTGGLPARTCRGSTRSAWAWLAGARPCSRRWS